MQVNTTKIWNQELKLKELGLMLTDKTISSLGGIKGVDGYRKAALAGENGELEHTALWHVPGGYAMRQKLSNSKQ